MPPINLLDFATQTFIALFVTMNPIGVSPIFASLTQGANAAYKKSMVQRVTLTVIFIMLIFALFGNILLDAIGISFYAFQLAGGIILLLTAIRLVSSNPKEISEPNKKAMKLANTPDDISVFPIAIPMLAGPGSMTTVVLQMGEAEGNLKAQILALSMLFLVLLITYLMLRYSQPITKLIGIAGVNVISRVLGILLSALACQFILDGIQKSGILA